MNDGVHHLVEHNLQIERRPQRPTYFIECGQFSFVDFFAVYGGQLAWQLFEICEALGQMGLFRHASLSLLAQQGHRLRGILDGRGELARGG